MFGITHDSKNQVLTRILALLILAMVLLFSVHVDCEVNLVPEENPIGTSARIMSSASLGDASMLEVVEISDKQQTLLKGDAPGQVLNRKSSVWYGGVSPLLIQLCFYAVVIQLSFGFFLLARRIIVIYIHDTDGMKSLN